MPCDVASLAEIQLFDALNDEDRNALAGVIDSQKVAQGETLFQAGEPGDSLFIVRAGEIELYIKDTVGQKIVLNVSTAGDMFGELALLDSGARTATAVALSDSELLVLDRGDLLLLFQKKPDAALHMLGVMSGMTRKADQLLRTRVSRNVNEEIEVHTSTLQRIADWI
nr:cyclic nucleotide-binding domain-containing protein [Acidobacteriota bacterium]